MFYEHAEYRDLIKLLMNTRKAHGLRVTYSQIAEICRVQKPYISKVMKGEAELNHDQLFNIGEFFNLNQDQQRYMELCLEYSRTALSARKKKLARTIHSIQVRHLTAQESRRAQVVETISDSFSRYYLDPSLQLAHIFLGSRKYRGDLRGIARKVGVSEAKVLELIDYLISSGLVEKKDGWYDLTKTSIHLSTDSQLCTPHQLLVRTKSMSHIQNSEDREALCFSLTFSGNDGLFRTLKSAFLAYIRESDELIEAAPAEDVFQMNFDLFRW